MRSWVFVAAVVAMGCVGCNPVKADYDNLCHAQERSGSNGTTPEDYANAMRWAERAMRTQEVRGVAARLPAMSPYDRGTLLRGEAAKAGIAPCPLADSWSPPQ